MRVPLPRISYCTFRHLLFAAFACLTAARSVLAQAPHASPAPASPITPAPAITFVTAEPLGILHFVHTAAGGEHSSQTYRAFIAEATAGDTAFAKTVGDFRAIDLSMNYRRPDLPRRRYRSRSVMDLLWIQAAAAHSLDDLSARTVGLLSAAAHGQLFRVLAKAQPYYRRLVAEPERSNAERMQRFLEAYAQRIGGLFAQVTRFYGTPWPPSVPFVTGLCPMPLASGVTTAVPKANTLVVGYLAGNPDEYKATLGVAVHEMCHSIYDEQPVALQQSIDDWFMLSRSPYATHAYSYFNEGLATAIGNGWAYAQLNGRPDEGAWYADEFIDGFARALYPLVVDYLEARRTIDRAFVDRAIAAFAKTFPNADRDFAVLVNAVGIYADTEDDALLTSFTEALTSRFRVNASYLRAPLRAPATQRTLGYPQLTKVIIVDRDRTARWRELAEQFPDLATAPLPPERNFYYAFYDESSRSAVVIFGIEDARGLDALLETLRHDRVLAFGQVVSLGRPGE